MNLLIGIINHKFNKEAILLKLAFEAYGDTYLVDSGSGLNESESAVFDQVLGNVYYSGMLNAVGDQFRDKPYDVILFLASDVGVVDPGLLIKQLIIAFSNPEIGMYAPSVHPEGSNHPQMRFRKNMGLSRVPFVDGFCFAVRVGIFRELHPIDTSLNKIGWGVDTFLAYLTLRQGYYSVVDHQVRVKHIVGPDKAENVDKYLAEAKEQRKSWFAAMEKQDQYSSFKAFRYLMYFEILKNAFGAKIVRIFFGKKR